MDGDLTATVISRVLFRFGFSIWLLLLLLPGTAFAQPFAGDDPFEPADPVPLVGRPVDRFSEASGAFRVEAFAEPASVPATEALTLTVRVIATLPPLRAPEVLPLKEDSSLYTLFNVEPLTDFRRGRALRAAAALAAGASPWMSPLQMALLLGTETSWTATFRLRPRTLDVREIPGLPFCFHDPRIPIPERSFQTAYSEPVPVRILPPEVVRIPLRAPEWLLQLPPQDFLLERQATWQPPEPWLLWLGAAIPPVLSLLWYLGWRWRYPDAARRARYRRSRAAQLALRDLGRATTSPVEQRPLLVVRVLTRYLHQRLDLPIAEPTPRETARHLRQAGCSVQLARQAFSLLQACDAARFQPHLGNGSPALCEQAGRLILSMEEET